MTLQLGAFSFLQTLTGNPLLDGAMIVFAEALVFLVPAVLVYLWFQGEAGRLSSVYVFLAVLAGIGISYGMGEIYQHPSPYESFDTLASGEPENSFPSQHTTALASLTAGLLWKGRRRLGYTALGATALTGFARIYIGEHYLIDILGAGGAALLGLVTALLVERYAGKYVEDVTELGHRIQRKVLEPVEKRI